MNILSKCRASPCSGACFLAARALLDLMYGDCDIVQGPDSVGRHHRAEYIHHLRYAKASGNELQTQLELASRIGLLSTEDASPLIRDAEEVGRILNGLITSLTRAHP